MLPWPFGSLIAYPPTLSPSSPSNSLFSFLLLPPSSFVSSSHPLFFFPPPSLFSFFLLPPSSLLSPSPPPSLSYPFIFFSSFPPLPFLFRFSSQPPSPLYETQFAPVRLNFSALFGMIKCLFCFISLVSRSPSLLLPPIFQLC